MAKKQKLKCPDCEIEFEFDPKADNKIITSLNESFRTILKKEVEVTAYLTCPNGHKKPYKVIKEY